MKTLFLPLCFYISQIEHYLSRSKNFILLVFVFLTILTSPTMSEENTHLQSVLQGNGVFTKNLYNILAKSEGNIFFSPISIHAILSLTAQGSDGATKEAFLKSLHVPSLDVIAEGYKNVMEKLNNIEDVTLYMANKVYIKDSYKLKESFKSAIVKYFYSEVQHVDFGKSALAAQTINSWVEKQTNEKIKDLISADDLDNMTALVLVNAIYFKGKWAKPFKVEATKTEKFYLNDNDTIDVQMMHLKDKFYYKEDESLDAKVLELPYTNPDVSMIIILPNNRNGIHELEEKLAGVDLTKITENMFRPEVEVSLPKFKIETTINLNDPLTQLGLAEMFGKGANFSGMLESDQQLCVSKVIQKAFIEVNEEGAEAAAATGVEAVTYCLVTFVSPTITFTVDHPFIVTIKQKIYSNGNYLTNTLFKGSVRNII